MDTREFLQKRKQELLDRFRAHDMAGAAELDGVLRALESFEPGRPAAAEFSGLDNLTAAERYLRRVGRATLDEMAEAVWEGGMRPPDELYSDGKFPKEEDAKTWVVWRFKQAIGRHLTAAHRGRDRLRKDKGGFIVLGSLHK